MKMKIHLGTHRHYKGDIYVVTAIARHTETGDEMVVYHLEKNKAEVWVRPASMFYEIVDEAKGTLRFEFHG